MNEKEIAEIRRRFHPDKCNITHIRGCYVNEKREIISEFNPALSMMQGEESEKLLAILKKALSGTLGKNLLDVTFSTQQVVDSDEHRLLMSLKNSGLQDEEAVQTLFHKAIDTVTLEGNYLVLLAHDRYDVPYRSSDGERQEGAGNEVFSYILCGVCPVKVTKPELSYSLFDNGFHNLQTDCIVGPPELGFLFPAFDDRSANIYNALYYTRDSAENHDEFVDAVFHSELPMPAAVQKETFQSMLQETLGEDCSYHVVQAVHEQLSDMILEHKVNKEPDPLVIPKSRVTGVLHNSGVSKERVEAFEERYDSSFGAETVISPRNIVEVKQFELHTPDVSIKVNPERSNLVETRIIDGEKYIVIRVDEGVEVNGVAIQIS